MEILSQKYNCKELSIFIISDVHEGNANHNERAFKAAVNHIAKMAEKRKVMTVLLGDMCDCINPKDPRFSPAEISNKYGLRDLKDLPRKQYQRLYEELKPIEDTIKAVFYGNHEESFVKYSGMDVVDYFCNDLLRGKPKKMGFEGIIKVSLEHQKKGKTFTIAATHGTGGGGYREGYVYNHCLDIFKKYDADIHVMGHVHKDSLFETDFITVGKNDKLKHRTKWYLTTGCFLDSHVEGTRGYFEGRKGLLSDLSFPEIRVDFKNNAFDIRVKKHRIRRK